MALEIRTGPRGPTALWNGKQLTSAYAPDREATAWVQALGAAPGTLVFVAGDPWGLAAGALDAAGCRGVALVPGPEAAPLVPPGVTAWTHAPSLEVFLSDQFDLWGPDAVRWEVWPAFERHAPEEALDWSRRFRDLYRTVQGSWLTHKRFGTRFWRNSLRNAADWDRPVSMVPGTRPLVIAASGPSLDDGLEALARNRSRFDLWALPSSFETLVQRGLVPDAGVATDGGFYAREHLQRLAGTDVPVLAALSSAPDPVLRARRCLFFSQGLPVEQALLGAFVPRFAEVPSQGTVAVTALRLALEATTGPVFIAGLDLSFRDLRGHTSPHTVDRRLATAHGRLAPSEGLWAQRRIDQAPVVHDGVRTSPAMLTYALWMRSRAHFARRVTRIAPTALRWDSMDEANWDEAEALWRGAAGRAVGWKDEPATAPDRRPPRIAGALAELARRVEAEPRAPWVDEAARTAVPDALADDFRARRRGQDGTAAPAALAAFIRRLEEEIR